MSDWDGKERRASMFNQDFYTKMIEMHGDMRHLRKWAENHDANDMAVHEKLDGRIKSLEENQAKVIGGAGALGALAGFITQWFHK